MKAKLIDYVKRKRLEQGLNTAQLAEKMGYRNINKGMRRIVELEREGKADPEILRKVVKALNLDQGYVDKLAQEDKAEYIQEFEQWLIEPVKMSYTIRVMSTVYLSYDLPAYIKTGEEAIKYTSAIAKEKSNLVWLKLDRKTTVFINELGEVTGKHEKSPYQSNSYTSSRII